LVSASLNESNDINNNNNVNQMTRRELEDDNTRGKKREEK
jgi:hypothetical protein